MAKNLVIVESPAKAKTIKKFLGADFEVIASMGHVADLPDKKLGIDIENGFEPTYAVTADKKKTVSEIKKSIGNAEKVWLATDEDREGEAIAWHLATFLKLPKNTPRIAFHEITKEAIQAAIKSPRTIDMNLVDAQQGRRLLDRLVGFKTSPVLWKKIRKGLSAGRVQSVAVKLVIEREREIKDFKPVESWKLKAILKDGKTLFEITLEKIGKKSANLKDNKEVEKVLSSLGLNIKDFKETKEEKNGWISMTSKSEIDFKLIDIKKSDSKRNPPPPFITSTLQQQASAKLGRGVKEVMSVAQKLYENGFITYMRTDSVNLSSLAMNSAQKFIEDEFGKKYSKPRQYKGKSANAQEAHEAIRPTYIDKTPEKSGLKQKELSLYTLIRKRTVASQMSEALLEITTYSFNPLPDDSQIWMAKGQVIKFDGFLKLYKSTEDEEDLEDTQDLPKLEKDVVLTSVSINAFQQFSRPPARYTEATLVKKMESEGIGRPSTYAPTITTIQTRGYIVKDGKYLIPTDIAFLVNDFLEKYFVKLMDYKFTATLEEELDKISLGKLDRKKMLKEFYKGYEESLQNALGGEVISEPVGRNCPNCGSELIYRFSKGGKFIGCSGYPECKYIENVESKDEKLLALKAKYEGQPCPEGGTIVVKIGRFGPFLTSSEYPNVKRISPIPDDKLNELQEQHKNEKCPKCNEGELRVKKYRNSYFLACSKYPDCKYTKSLK